MPIVDSDPYWILSSCCQCHWVLNTCFSNIVDSYAAMAMNCDVYVNPSHYNIAWFCLWCLLSYINIMFREVVCISIAYTNNPMYIVLIYSTASAIIYFPINEQYWWYHHWLSELYHILCEQPILATLCLSTFLFLDAQH